jgi:Coenzyme F420-reducing hydrogenase, beta subunit
MGKIYFKKEYCCGCTVCKTVCNSDAIAMVADESGFLYPEIDESKCVDCKKCYNICQYTKTEIEKYEAKNVYAVQHRDENVLKESSSGGVYTAISDILLNEDYILYSCVMDKNLDVFHHIVHNKNERDNTRGSKYVQSDLRDTYKEILELLKTKKVCFIGTPCQVAGLQLLSKYNKNLFTIDFLCHGVQSQSMFKDHIKYLENIYKKNIVDYKFRDKKFGWIHTESISFSDNKRIFSHDVQWLKCLFYSNRFLRTSCYNCLYTTTQRVSDITIGDYWGVENHHAFYDNKGVSLLILNSEKGKKILPQLYESCTVIESKLEYAMQRTLKNPPNKPKEYDDDWNYYYNFGYEALIKKYCNDTLKQKFSFYYRRVTHFLKLDRLRILLNIKIRKISKYVRKK